MATIRVENAEVTSVMKTGKGFRIQTMYKIKDGTEVAEKWVVWTGEKVNVGDVVTVEGKWSKKDERFTNDANEEIKYTSYNINDTTVNRSAQPSALAQKGEAALREQWPSATVDEAPF